MKNNNVILVINIVILIFLLTSCSFVSETYDDKLGEGVTLINYEEINEALEDGADINKIGGMVWFREDNPCKIAIRKGHNDIVRYLIEKGADPNYADWQDITFLMDFAYNGDAEFCEFLLEAGTDIEAKDNHGDTALESVMRSRHTEKELEATYDVLINNGAQITPRTLETALEGFSGKGYTRYNLVRSVLEGLLQTGSESGLDPLMEAAILGDSKLMKELLKTDNPINEADKILFFTAAFGDVETLQMLEEKGASLDTKDIKNNSLLSIAARYGQTEVVKYLLSNGADIEAQNYEGQSALILAAQYDQIETVDYLMESGAKSNYLNAGVPVDILAEAAKNGSIEMMETIVNNSEQFENERLGMVMSFAAWFNQKEIITYLIDMGVDADIEYNEGSALEECCLFGHLDLAKYLVEQGANVEGIKESNVPLDVAASYGKQELVQYLLEQGADSNGVGLYNTSPPIVAAIAYGHYEIIKLLVEYGADLEMSSINSQNTPLIIAAQNGSRNILEYLLQQGADINNQGEDGLTALMAAVERGRTENVKILLEYGVDTELKDDEGRTALDIADDHHYKEIKKLIKKNR